MNRTFVCLTFLFVKLLSAQSAEVRSGAPIASERPAESALSKLPANYVIGSEDVLAINIWKEPDVSRSVPVRPDGKISLPLIGEMDARGLTPEQLQVNLHDRLSSFIANPEVTVIVQEVKSQKFNIVGEVSRPGTYPLTNPMTVLDAIAAAGGFRDFAKTKKIYVLRSLKTGEKSRLPFNYKEVIKGFRLEQNIELQSHDTVVVP